MRSLTTRDVAVASPKLIQALQAAKTLEDELQRFYGELRGHMEQANVRSITGQWGSVSLATRKTWHADGLDTKYYKQVVDTTKLNHLYKAGELPAGASFSESTYLTKRIK